MNGESRTNRTDRAPFINLLQDTNLSPDNVIKVIEGVPDKIVRAGGSERVDIAFDDLSYSEDILQKYKTGERLLDELEADPYYVHHPKTRIVVGEDNDGRPKVMLVSDRVEGVSLAEALRHGDEEAIRKTSTMLSGLSANLLDKSQKGGEFLYDWKLAQFIYGNTPTNPENEVYDVDTDPLFDHTEGLRADKPVGNEIGLAFVNLARMIGEIETACDRVDTSVAKEVVHQFVSSVDKNAQPHVYAISLWMKQEFNWISAEEDRQKAV